MVELVGNDTSRGSRGQNSVTPLALQSNHTVQLAHCQAHLDFAPQSHLQEPMLHWMGQVHGCQPWIPQKPQEYPQPPPRWHRNLHRPQKWVHLERQQENCGQSCCHYGRCLQSHWNLPQMHRHLHWRRPSRPWQQRADPHRNAILEHHNYCKTIAAISITGRFFKKNMNLIPSRANSQCVKTIQSTLLEEITDDEGVPYFTSLEPTKFSTTEGCYLLFMQKEKATKAMKAFNNFITWLYANMFQDPFVFPNMRLHRTHTASDPKNCRLHCQDCCKTLIPSCCP